MPEGHIVCLPTTESGPLVMETLVRICHSSLLLAEAGLNANSLFYNAVSSQAVVMGHLWAVDLCIVGFC